MIALLKQLIMQAKNLLGGALSTSVNGLSDKIPDGWLDMSLFTDTTNIFGFSVPTFLIYYIFIDD